MTDQNSKSKQSSLEKSSSGFFGWKRKSTHKKKNSSSSSLKTTSSNHSQRRVVKATAPPPLSESSDSAVLVDYPPQDNDDDSTTPPEKSHTTSGNQSFPSVQNQDQLEKTEQWRKERMNANAAIRKDAKEKEVTEHRRRAGSVENNNGEGANVPQPVPAILSVAPKFPEHKRKIGGEDDHVGKKSRVSEEEQEQEEDSTAGDGHWKDKIPGWLKAIGPAAAVAAAAAIIATRYFRPR